MAEQVFDVFNPQISKVVRGLGSKIITIYGSEGTGKSKQCASMSKPLFLCFEEGLGAINTTKLPIETWADFIKYNKQLCDKKSVAQARELYDTIILDSIDAMEQLCTDYVCIQNGVRAIGDIPHGAGYKIYENTFWKEVNKITKAGYTCIFIGHPAVTGTEGDKFINIKGDLKRTVQPITSRSDVVCYLQPMGVDDDGKPIHSSAWLVQTKEFFARSRFEEIVPYLDEFTAANLEKAIIDAIDKEEANIGKENMTTFEENKKVNQIIRKSYDELMEEMKGLAATIVEAGKNDDLTYIVEQHLGPDKRATELRKGQEPIIESIVLDFKEYIEENLA